MATVRRQRSAKSPERSEEDLMMSLDDAVNDDDEGPVAKRRPWGPEEDEHLRQLVDQYGIKSWAAIATNLTNRNGKQCRERWRNHLRPQLNKGDWSVQEDIDIWEHVQEMGTKWAQVCVCARVRAHVQGASHACVGALDVTRRRAAPCAYRPLRSCASDLGAVHGAAH